MDLHGKYKGKKRWIGFLTLLFDRYFEDDIGKSAAALTYYAVFTVFPFLIFVTMLLGFLKLPAIPLQGELSKFMPDEVIAILNMSLMHITEERSSTLLVFGLVFTLWFPLRSVKSLMTAINHAYGYKKHRSVIRQGILVLLFALFLLVFVIVSLIILIVGEGLLGFIAGFFPISITSIFLWSRLRFLVLAVLLFLVVSSLYYVSPSKRPVRKYVFPGALAALISWLVFSVGFAYYVDNMANYSVIYGSIGAVIVFLMWIYFSAVTILMGAEFNRVLMVMDE